MDVSSIAAMSTSLSMAETQQGVAIAMIKETMELQENLAANLVENMQDLPSFGHKLDIRA